MVLMKTLIRLAISGRYRLKDMLISYNLGAGTISQGRITRAQRFSVRCGIRDAARRHWRR